MPGADIIVMENLAKTFGTGWPWKRVKALLGIDLAVREGEIIGYLGPNGAGKTTTLKLMVGLLRPTKGRILIGGMPPENPRSRDMIGFLPENPYFYEYLTGREFLGFCGRLGDKASGGFEKRIGLLLDKVGLSDAADRPLRKYSKGMLQRIGLAQALINDPPVLILDEPMSALDPVGRREIRDLIIGLKEEGKTIFFSSHILADVEMICDRVAFLHLGRLLEVRSLVDLMTTQRGMVEVKAAGLDDNTLDSFSEYSAEILRGPEASVLVLESDEAMPEVLEKIGRSGGRLLSVNPRRQSLEDYFMKLVGEVE